MANFTVVYDACLFYPAPLRDLMIRLAQTRRFRAHWTEAIQREWLIALLRNRPELDEIKLSRTMTLMNQAVPDCLITGYEYLTEQLSLPDPNDRHVLAAAIRCGAQAIVTMNVKDFPAETLASFEIFARHPDDFILDLADLEPAVVTTAAKRQRAALKDPPLSPDEFVSKLRRQGLPGVAAFLQHEIALI
ncbi:PIN domain-containing protein [uncultured Thiocystis sp.]|uniref:PIN domain-containing protein n=1 Tax=uncultured Thiocystis sp. TaxID=1202134 RepID=UPI0025DDE673|nr:PIN domain-containing protein [uncultured Thiocystis sp.]